MSAPNSNQVITASKRNEFERLCHEFLHEYAETEAGQRHAARYAEARENGRANFRAITAQTSTTNADTDITEDILLKLLPYGDTAINRENDAWIHVAQVFNIHVRTKYEATGWIQPGDWPAIADAILRFVQRCNSDPAQLDAACREFSALPFVKGFQTGTLTPILNALRPDDFALVNNKSRQTLNYFADTAFSLALTEYPAANAGLHQLVAVLADSLHDARPGVRADDLFNMFSQWLVSTKRFTFPRVRYWHIAPGEQTWQWSDWREGNYIAMGWGDLEDVSVMTRSQFEARRDELAQQRYDLTKVGAEQVWKFARQISIGDRIVANHGTQAVLGIGTVTSAYHFVPNVPQGHRYTVDWDDLTQRAVDAPDWRKALQELDNATFRMAANAPEIAQPRGVTFDLPEESTQPEDSDLSDDNIVADETTSDTQVAEAVETNRRQPLALAEEKVPYIASTEDANAIQPTYTLTAAADASGLDEAVIARWVNAIERKGQAIFYGPPGTGKTFMAEQLARHLVSAGAQDSDIQNSGDGFWELVQFHPAYAYEDFIQGIRPQSDAGGLRYPVVPGRFLEFCARAAKCSGRCVLIIDEINRANLARVFGELMYLLEYRDQSVVLAGNGEEFHIPANVRIIGTMNTADRSIALVDHALRRRFAFIALQPNFEILRRYHKHKQTEFPVEPLISLLHRVNSQIGDRHYELGIAFFLREKLSDELPDIWQMEIEPYLEEYFFDQPDLVEELRWAKVGTAF